MSLCVSGINLDEIKKELTSIGKIKELKIRMQAPNPSDELLDDLQRRCDGLVKEFKDANVTELEFFYSTKGASGIDLTAPLIDEKINDIQGLHSGLPVEEYLWRLHPQLGGSIHREIQNLLNGLSTE